MDKNAPSTEKLSVIYIEVDKKKMGHIPLSHSSTATQLRNHLSERYDISSNMRFLDAEGYPISVKDEQSIIISDLLVENDVIHLKTEENIPVPEKKSNASRERSELNFASSPIQAATSSLPGPTIPGSLPNQSSYPIIMANELDFNTWKKIFDNCSLLCGIRMNEKEPIRAIKPVLKFKESANSITRPQVYDSSRIHAYTRNNRMESSFVSNDYFDGGIQFSSPYIGIGIDVTYSKTTAKTNEERTIYSTCFFNHPRVIVELDVSYLEPTENFINDIEHVFQNLPIKSELERVLSTYGHVYPQRVILGGHLFYSEQHFVKGNIDEEKIQKDAEIRFKTAYFKQAEIHGGIGSSSKTKQESSQYESSITFQAVGGNTLLCRNPTVWTETVANPMLWRIIEQSSYKSVLTLLNEQQKEEISKICDENAKLQERISKCENGAEVCLDNQKLIDRGIDLVVKQAIINKKCKELFLGWNKMKAIGAIVLADAVCYVAKSLTNKILNTLFD